MRVEPDNRSNPEGFKDRSGRLVVFGVIAVCVGLLSFALALMQVGLALLGPLLPDAQTVPIDQPSLFMGALLYALIGAAFVWIGVGSTLKRRWVRPLMLTLAWTWCASGLLAALFAPRLVQSMALTAPLPQETAGLIHIVVLLVLVVIAGFGILLPAAFIWVYRDRDLLRTCELHDPRRCWTERCPTPVLGLSVGLGACAVAALPMLARPALPFFNFVLTGWPAAVVLVAGALFCAYLARSTYRLERSGWWGSVALFVLLGLSTGISFAVLDPGELQRAMGYPESTAGPSPGTEFLGGGLAVGVSVLLTAVSLVYMARIRRHFTG